MKDDINGLILNIFKSILSLGITIFILLLILKGFTSLDITWKDVFIPLYGCIPYFAFFLLLILKEILFSKMPEVKLDKEEVQNKINRPKKQEPIYPFLYIKDKMTFERAKYVKELRENGEPFKRIAKTCYNEWEKDACSIWKSNPSNQTVGTDLWKSANEFLNREYI